MNSKRACIYAVSLMLSGAIGQDADQEKSGDDIYHRYVGGRLDIWTLDQRELNELRGEIENVSHVVKKALLLATLGDDRGFEYIRERYEAEKAGKLLFGSSVTKLMYTEHPKAVAFLAGDLDNERILTFDRAGSDAGRLSETAAKYMLEIIARSGFFPDDVRDWAGEKRDRQERWRAAKEFWRTNAETIRGEKYNEVTVPEAMDPLASQEEGPKGGTRATPNHEEPISVMTNVMEDNVVSQDNADSQVAASSREGSSDGSMGMGQWYWWTGGLLAALGLGYMAWNRRNRKDKA